jgi:RND family efflux transporter MFP subunit
MKYRSPVRTSSALVLGFFLGLMGCARAPSETPPAAPVTVTVSYPVEREVTDYSDFTARIAAVDSVEVRAHVWGYLEKVHFKEGTLVKKGDVLFELDPRSYQADYDRAVANLAQAKAHLARLEADFQRAQTLIQSAAIAKADYDLALGDRNEAAAMVGVAEAALNTTRLNLGYTKVTAPVSGRVSRYLVTVGNLIQSADLANVSLLTTIVSVDPMYAYFDVDERTVQRVRQWLRQGKAESAPDTGLPVALGLATEEGFPHQGTINFVDNQVNPKTGTLRVRGVFPNKDEVLSAGFFARVRVPISPPHKALLVSDRALDTDQGQKVLYVVNDKNEVVSRPIRVGSLHDGLRAIEDGLKPGERVIVNGLQQVRPGVTVEPKLVDMPASVVRGRESGGGKQGGPTRVAKAMP